MKIPLSWLKKYVRINTDPEEIARLLTLSGTEVTQITKLGSEWDKDLIIAAEAKSIEPHPSSIRSCWCKPIQSEVKKSREIESHQNSRRLVRRYGLLRTGTGTK